MILSSYFGSSKKVTVTVISWANDMDRLNCKAASNKHIHWLALSLDFSCLFLMSLGDLNCLFKGIKYDLFLKCGNLNNSITCLQSFNYTNVWPTNSHFLRWHFMPFRAFGKTRRLLISHTPPTHTHSHPPFSVTPIYTQNFCNRITFFRPISFT